VSTPSNQPLSGYAESSGAPVFSLRAKPHFSPLDVNVAFLFRAGWNQSVDRLRFHIEQDSKLPEDHPVARVVNHLDPHLLIRRLDRDEDRFISLRASVQGEIVLLSQPRRFRT
jgi:hypothetical protein